MNNIIKLIIGLIIAGLVVLFFTAYTVDQTQKAFVLRLGKIQLNSQGQPKIEGPGLHFKLPFVTTVKHFDMRLRTMNISSSRIVTEEQKDVIVDAFVKWRLKDVVKFFKATGGNQLRADTLLRQKVSDGLREEFGKEKITDLISGKRGNVMAILQAKANSVADGLGVEVVDVRIKRIDLPTEVANSVYARMRSDREKEAARIRSTGKEEAEKIKAKADADVTVLMATAKSDAAKVRALGDKQAADIYAKAYSTDPGFYQFLRSMESYEQVFDANHHATIVMRPNTEFFKLFTDPKLNAVKPVRG